MVRTNFLMTAPLLMASFCSAQEKPNVVLILVDDMGYSDIGCYGGEILTPNIDALASKGVRFTQFYNTSRSCPARASLMTGLYQHQAGIGQMSEDPFANPDQKSPNDWGAFDRIAADYDHYARSWAEGVLAQLLGHAPSPEEIAEAVTAGERTRETLRKSAEDDRARDCSPAMAVGYGVDADSEEEKMQDYHTVRGIR